MWGLHSPIPTLSDLLASTGTPGATAKCTDPMFGPMGAMFDWAQSLGKWVPRNARIYGSGVGTVYTASAGDINTDVQVGALTIPESLVFPGVEIRAVVGCNRRLTGAAGSTAARMYCSGIQILDQGGVTQGNESHSQGFARWPSNDFTLRRPGARTVSHGYGVQSRLAIAPSSGSYPCIAAFNATTVNSESELTANYVELSYGG